MNKGEEKRGEITVFLSLILVCMLSLILCLLESARTAGARLYAQMAADSAAASVMSQYNRNLWDMYHLLFLEAESDTAIVQSFSDYLEYYTNQDNLYPMELADVNMDFCEKMTDNGGKALEKSIFSYMKYQMLDELGSLGEEMEQISEDAAKALKTEDFREWFEVCHKTGKKCRKLDRYHMKAEKSLSRLRNLKENLVYVVDDEMEEQWEVSETDREQFCQETERFFEYVNDYERELKRISEHLEELKKEESKEEELLVAYENVESEGKKILETFMETKTVLKGNLDILERLDEDPRLVSQLKIPGNEMDDIIDQEKSSALDRLEELFQGSLLELVLPEHAEISSKNVSLKQVPSSQLGNKKTYESENPVGMDGAVSKVLVNEYCFLAFDSFLEQCGRKMEPKFQPLEYEQEYLLCGKNSDRENLAKTVEKLMAVRGAANFTCLLSSTEKRAEANQLAASVTGGNAPVMFVVAFLILTLWAFGEAVMDVKQLMQGGAVPYWKQENEWKLSLEGLLAFQFMEPVQKKQQEGSSYRDHMRILFFLTNQKERNFRMMDVIQWNLRTIQENFAVEDCCQKVELSANLQERHLFFTKDIYKRTIKTVGAY